MVGIRKNLVLCIRAPRIVLANARSTMVPNNLKIFGRIKRLCLPLGALYSSEANCSDRSHFTSSKPHVAFYFLSAYAKDGEKRLDNEKAQKTV